MFKTSFKAVRAAFLAAFVLLIACEAGAQRVRLKQLERKLGVPIGPEREWYIGVTDTFGDQRYKRLDTLIAYIADSVDTDTDEQYVDSFYIQDDTLYISLVRDGTRKLVDLKPYLALGDDIQYIDTFYFDMDTLYISLIRDGMEPQKVYLGDLISLADQDKQRHDSAFVLNDTLYLSLQRDSIPAHEIDLTPYLDNTDSQYYIHSEGANSYTNELSGSGGSNFTLIGGTGVTIDEDGGGNVTISAPYDHDWYEVGTTTPPDAITDEMFHTGKTGIGMNPVYLLDVAEDARIYGHQVGRGGGNISGNFRAGLDALSSNTTGYYLTAIGAYALDANTTAYENTAVGYKSLWKLTTGIWNTALGAFSMENCITCYDNTAIGLYALNSMSSGQQNTALGHGAGYYNGVGGGNTFLGDLAGFTDSFPTRNVAIGQYAMEYGKTHLGNIAIGYQAINPISGGYNNKFNVAIGYEAVTTTTLNNSDYNVGIGYRSFYNFVGGDNNVAIGPSNGSSLSGSNNYIFGQSNTVTGGVDNNVIIGYNQTMTTAGNIVITNGAGTLALKMLSTGLVGIGEATPTQKLHVAGSARITGAIYDSNNDPGTLNQKMISTVTGIDWVDDAAASGTNLAITNSANPGLTSSTGSDVIFQDGTGIDVVYVNDFTVRFDQTAATFTDEIQDVSFGYGPGYSNITLSGSISSATIDAGDGITITAQSGTNMTLNAVDVAANNEGYNGVGAGTATSSTITTNTSGGNAITLQIAGTLSISETTNSNGGTITITGTGGAGTVTSIGIAVPTGLGVSPSTITTAGTFTFSLNNDLQAVENLGTTGMVARTGVSTWETRTLTASGSGLSIVNGNGVLGPPTYSLTTGLQSFSTISSSGIPYFNSGTTTWATAAFTSLSTGLTNGTFMITDGSGTPGDATGISYNAASSGTLIAGQLVANGALTAGGTNFQVNSSGHVYIGSLPTFDTDAAAASLSAGRVYKSSTGALRIKL